MLSEDGRTLPRVGPSGQLGRPSSASSNVRSKPAVEPIERDEAARDKPAAASTDAAVGATATVEGEAPRAEFSTMELLALMGRAGLTLV